MKTILFIEDRPHVFRNFVHLLNTRIEFFKLLPARTVLQAVNIVSKIKVDVILMGRHVNRAELDLLDRRLKRSPGTRLIVPTKVKSPLANLLNTLEYTIRFDMPVDTSLLLDVLLKEFGVDYGGQIHGISLSSFLQMIELEGSTCTIGVAAGKAMGQLYFDSGDLINARRGDQSGKAAALEILAMQDALISVNYGLDPSCAREIETPLMSLLIEAARIYDEASGENPEQRRYERIECALSTMFDANNVAYKGVIRNVSMDGIYIESDHRFFAGQDICVTLFSQSLAKGCRISGMVVRHKGSGIGIQFSELSMNQKRIVALVMDEIQCVQHRHRHIETVHSQLAN